MIIKIKKNIKFNKLYKIIMTNYPNGNPYNNPN